MRVWWSIMLLALPGAALAQPAGSQNFGAVLQNAGHQAEVLDAARQTPAWVHEGCATATFTRVPEVGVYAQIRFDASGAPIAGTWREALLAKGCGAAMTLNVLTKVTAPGTLATGPLQPGGTIADPVLQNAAQASVVRAAGGIPAGCMAAYIENTVFGGYEGKADSSLPAWVITAPWKEIWSLNSCGPVKAVTLHFKPDAQGVSITPG